MRTTLTLDADVVAELEEHVRKTGTTWKAAVNDAIRRGLHANSPPERIPYATPVTDPGLPRLQGVHGVHDLLAFAEGEDYR